MAKKETKPAVETEVKEEIKVEEPVAEKTPEAEPVSKEEPAVETEVKEAPERIFYVEGYGNVIAKSEKEAKKKADAIMAKIRG